MTRRARGSADRPPPRPRGRRVITVDERSYYWSVRRKGTYSQLLGRDGLVVAITGTAPGGQRLVVETGLPRIDSWLTFEVAVPVTPAQVRAWILEGVRQGWTPESPGSPLQIVSAPPSPAIAKVEYVVDGADFETLEQFYEVVSRVLIPNADWGRNLDAFNDILRGGFGTPEGGFVFIWKNAARSRVRLGHAETARVLQARLGRCHPSNREHVARELEAASRNEGPTVFDGLVEIIEAHGPGGAEATSGVELRLES